MLKKTLSGMTLVEVIVSLSLVSFIGVSLLTLLGTQFQMLANAKSITKESFAAMQKFERNILDVKQKLINREDVGLTSKEYTLFGKYEVTGYEMGQVINTEPDDNPVRNRMLKTIVADNCIPPIPVSSLENFKTTLFYNANKVSTYYAVPNTKIDSSFIVKEPDGHPGIHLMTTYQWYISRKGFVVPVPADVSEGDDLRLYPVFPDDYQLLGGERSESLSEIKPSYAGRHLVLLATPVAKSGKMGVTVTSQPIYIRGLQIVDGLYSHVDASILDGSTLIGNGGNTIISKWGDISGGGGSFSQSNQLLAPKLSLGEFGFATENNGRLYPIHGYYTNFLAGNSASTAQTAFTSTGLTVFVVAKRLVNSDDSVIKQQGTSANGSWNMNFSKFSVTSNSFTNEISVNNPLQENQWHVLGANVNTSMIKFLTDKSNIKTANRSNSAVITGNAPIVLGGGTDFAEVIIYKRALSESEMFQVRTYLVEKYGIE